MATVGKILDPRPSDSGLTFGPATYVVENYGFCAGWWLKDLGWTWAFGERRSRGLWLTRDARQARWVASQFGQVAIEAVGTEFEIFPYGRFSLAGHPEAAPERVAS